MRASQLGLILGAFTCALGASMLAQTPSQGQQVTVELLSSGHSTTIQDVRASGGAKCADSNTAKSGNTASIVVPFTYDCRGDHLEGRAVVDFPAGPLSGIINAQGNLVLDTAVTLTARTDNFTYQRDPSGNSFPSGTLELSLPGSGCASVNQEKGIGTLFPQQWSITNTCNASVLVSDQAGGFGLGASIHFNGGVVDLLSQVFASYAARASARLKILSLFTHSPNRSSAEPVRFEEGASIVVTVGTPTKDPNENAVLAVSGVSLKVSYDDVEVASGKANPNGFGEFLFSLPSTTAQGRSKHQIKVQASKELYQPAEATREIEVWRGLDNTKLLVNPIAGTYQVGQSVTVRGKVFVDGFKPWGNMPVQAQVSVSDFRGAFLGMTTTQPDGSFSVGVQLTKGLGAKNILIVTAVAASPGQYGDAQAEFVIDMEPAKTLQLTLGTGKAVYHWDETVAVAGTITAEGSPGAVNIQFFVDHARQGEVTTTGSGSFDFAFVPPLQAQQVFAPGAQHFVVAVAKAPGYEDAAVVGYFLIGGEDLPCVPLPLTVLNVRGRPTASSLIPPDTVPPLASGPNLTVPQTIQVPRASLVRPGASLAQDMSVRTGVEDTALLSLPVEGGEVRIAVDGKTELKIGLFCRDASGKVKLVLAVDNPGKILVNISSPSGAPLPLDYEIITPRTLVKSVKTRYAVAIDEEGATTVASLEGTVVVSDLTDTNNVQVDATKQLTVPIGQLPDQSQVTARTLAIDPALEEMLLSETGIVPPRLSAFLSQDQLILSWPVAASNYMLELATSLTQPVTWSSLTNAWPTVGDQVRASITPGSSNLFCRLHKL